VSQVATGIKQLQSWALQDTLLDHMRHLLSPRILLSDVLFDVDFLPLPPTVGSDDVLYVTSGDLNPFLPTIIGGVKAVYDGGHDLGFTIELGSPRYSTHEMDVLFWNQLSVLNDTLDMEAQQPKFTTTRKHFESVIPWSSSPSTADADCGRIFVWVGSGTEVKMRPAVCVSGPCGDPRHLANAGSSTATMSGMSDDEEAVEDTLSPQLDSLVAIQCKLERRDFSRPSSSRWPTFVRLYQIHAKEVEIVF